MKGILVVGLLLIIVNAKSQTCNCEREFLYIKSTIEQNFSGFNDKIKAITKKTYDTQVDEFLKLTHNRFASDNCLLIIYKYLDFFKSHHLGFYNISDPYKTDTDFVNHRPIFKITANEIEKVKNSKSWEGIYYSIYDSSYKIAVIKDPSPLHDYIGVMLESKQSPWKRGTIKFEGKLLNDSLLEGLLYMRNQHPKLESFLLWDHNNRIGGDWRRIGIPKSEIPKITSTEKHYSTIDAEKITANTLYIKIATFDADYKSQIDSLLHANETILNSTENVILDLRYNGGGSDNSWTGLIPYVYTKPIVTIGADLLATETTISAYKKFIENNNFSEQTVTNINNKITKMEQAKGQWITGNEDETDSSHTPRLFPKKVLILINKWCGSSTEEFLLAVKSSSKVILAGANTIGNLDYSNIVEIPFSCFPYTLTYPTTRSRRLNVHQGIDNIGIAPQYKLSEPGDWIKDALIILEK